MSLVKKKILYVENGIGYGDAIICLRNLVRHLDRNRFEPLVVTGRTSSDYQAIGNEVQWQYIPDRHFDNVGLRVHLTKQAWINKLPGLRFICLQLLARADDIFNFLPFFFRLLWVAKTFHADLIHANNEPFCNRAALLVAKVLQIPCVCHERGGNHKGSALIQWAYSLPDHFIAVSRWVAKSMQEQLHLSSSKISIVYDGIDFNSLDIDANGAAFRRNYGIPDTAFAVGLVGLLIPWKGQEIFFDAAKLLQQKIPQLKMVVVGGTPNDYLPYEALLRQRIDAEQLSNLIILTGHVSAMAEMYKGLDVVVSASTQPEPFGVVVVEAMAMKRPVIAPNHGGAAEIIESNATGLLFDPGDAQSLAQAIEKLYSSPSLCIKLGQNARSAAVKSFAIEDHVKWMQGIYEELLDCTKK